MASNPIVLTSNLIPDLKPNIGALANVYTNPDPVRRDPTIENEDGTFTIPTYQRTVIDIPDDFDWSMYGRAGPTLRYFNRVRTGEIEYDPNNDVVDESTLGGDDGDGDGGGSGRPTEAEMIKQELISLGKDLAAGYGGQIGRAVAANVTSDLISNPADGFDLGDISEGFSDLSSEFKPTNILYSPKEGVGSKFKYSPETKNAQNLTRGGPISAEEVANLEAKIPKLNETINATPETQTDIALRDDAIAKKAEIEKRIKPLTGTGVTGGFEGYLSGVGDRSGFGRDAEGNMSAAGRSNIYGAAGTGLATVAGNLIAGRNLKDSAKAGIKSGLTTYALGTLIPGGFGTFLGAFLGGRVICNELMRQGIMTRKQVVLDYKFTEDYLTPQHVAGYHVWAVWMVRQMRKGRLVNFWKHVAGHRANEIAYIYGDRDKPDYLGKVYRKILEPICWSIGFFCKKTDWTVLYKQKEV